ncbi:MAG TPA: hypothetical protein PLN56_04760 [Methanoregulaceae archaeon]|nr:hypothetical protein [Methanoregulaceae archaeon]
MSPEEYFAGLHGRPEDETTTQRRLSHLACCTRIVKPALELSALHGAGTNRNVTTRNLLE